MRVQVAWVGKYCKEYCGGVALRIYSLDNRRKCCEGVGSTVDYAGIHAWGERGAGLLLTAGETLLIEPGTERCLWLVHKWIGFG